MWLLKNPLGYDVLVAPNLYGDIISDLLAQWSAVSGSGARGTSGRISRCLSLPRLRPEVCGPVQSEPDRHDTRSKDDARLAGETEKGRNLEAAVASVILEGKVRTYDMGGNAGTLDLARAIAGRI